MKFSIPNTAVLKKSCRFYFESQQNVSFYNYQVDRGYGS